MADYVKWLRSKVGCEPVILVGVCGVIENSDHKILLQRRKGNQKWGLPGGHMEIGETAEMTLNREIKEELNLTTYVKDFIGVYTDRPLFRYSNGDVSQPVGIFFNVVTDGTIKLNDESIDVSYFGEYELPFELMEIHRQPILDFFNGKKGVVT